MLIHPRFAGLDTPAFYDYAVQLARGDIPYRDFGFEYPPLAVVPIVLPQLALRFAHGGDLVRYDWLLIAENVLCVVATAGCMVLLARKGWSHVSPGRMLVRYALLVAATPVLFLRFDQPPTLLMMLGLVAFAWGRRASSGVALGIGAATKLFPLFIAPVLAAADLMRRDWKGTARLVAGATVAVAIVGAVFYLVAGTSELSFLTYHVDRGVQLESLLATIGLVAQALGAPPASVFHAFGSFQLDSPFLASVPWLPVVLAIGLVIPLAASTLARFRADVQATRELQPATLVTQLLATLLVVLLVYRVLSPQYLAWLLPLAAMRPRFEFWLTFVICLVTFAIYPLAYDGLVALTPSAVVALILRNALLVAMFAWLIVRPRAAVAARPMHALTSAA